MGKIGNMDTIGKVGGRGVPALLGRLANLGKLAKVGVLGNLEGSPFSIFLSIRIYLYQCTGVHHNHQQLFKTL